MVPKVTCLLTELTEEAVTKHLLEFFEKLASEPSDAGKDRESKQDRGASEDHRVIGPPARHAFAVVGHSHIIGPAGYRVRPPRGMGGLAGHSINATSKPQFRG